MSKNRENSKGPAAVVSQRGFYGIEEIQGGELQVGGAVGPVGFKTEVLFVLKPVGDLFDRGLLEVGGERSLAGGGVGAGRNIPSCISDTSERGGRRREKGERRIQ
jgi:hypothetical protein